ncbi:hypothetical protein L3Q65_01190 (plasmid) [Amycolatopsis sp. FU40]|uniref:hypothetical protein n=1 Tax=Amycolatopsis sp. FU40 TaxID=2914159 RepID=UPI001F26DAB2|nr:hypothetical protein [Amycolatopsis sp. FU40]UKD50940.1 hypothetical protein L3Q65_01190 [Amycolatopsis sp. FU40]
MVLHVIDQPASLAGDEQLQLLEGEMLANLARFGRAVTVEWGPASSGPAGIELDLQPHSGLSALREVVAGTCRQVFPQAADSAPWQGRSVVAYRRDTIDAPGLLRLADVLRRAEADRRRQVEAVFTYLRPVKTVVAEIRLVQIDPCSDSGFVFDETSEKTFPLQTPFRPPATQAIELRADDACDDAVASFQALVEDPRWIVADLGASLQVARATVAGGTKERAVVVYTDVEDPTGMAQLLGPDGGILASYRGTTAQACTRAARWLAEASGQSPQ